jgi:hypothetical protein
MANTPDEFPIFTKLNKRQLVLLSSKFKFYLSKFEEIQEIVDIIQNPQTHTVFS